MNVAILLVIFTFTFIGSAVFAAEEVTERAVRSPREVLQQAPRAGTSNRAPTMEQQVTALQQQVQALQAQIAALQSVLVVTPSGATLQAQTVTVSSPQGIVIQSQKNIALNAGAAMNLQSGATLGIKGNSTTTVEGIGGLHLKGATIKLNNGSKQMATVGSAVGNGKILTGSPVIFGN